MCATAHPPRDSPGRRWARLVAVSGTWVGAGAPARAGDTEPGPTSRPHRNPPAAAVVHRGPGPLDRPRPALAAGRRPGAHARGRVRLARDDAVAHPPHLARPGPRVRALGGGRLRHRHPRLVRHPADARGPAALRPGAHLGAPTGPARWPGRSCSRWRRSSCSSPSPRAWAGSASSRCSSGWSRRRPSATPGRCPGRSSWRPCRSRSCAWSATPTTCSSAGCAATPACPGASPTAVAVVVLAVVIAAITNNVVLRGTLAVVDQAFGGVNEETYPGFDRPTSPTRSGSPASLVPWDTLGKEGRRFVAAGREPAQLGAAAGRPGVEPIRAYVGLESAPDPQARADLAVAELDREGAFSRPVIGVITTTGTGWVDDPVADSIEAIYGGDTALVATPVLLPAQLAVLRRRPLPRGGRGADADRRRPRPHRRDPRRGAAPADAGVRREPRVAGLGGGVQLARRRAGQHRRGAVGGSAEHQPALGADRQPARPGLPGDPPHLRRRPRRALRRRRQLGRRGPRPRPRRGSPRTCSTCSTRPTRWSGGRPTCSGRAPTGSSSPAATTCSAP